MYKTEWLKILWLYDEKQYKNLHLQYTWTQRSVYLLQYFLSCTVSTGFSWTSLVRLLCLIENVSLQLLCTVLQCRRRGELTNQTKGAFQGSPHMQNKYWSVISFLLFLHFLNVFPFPFLFISFSVENKMTRRYRTHRHNEKFPFTIPYSKIY